MDCLIFCCKREFQEFLKLCVVRLTVYCKNYSKGFVYNHKRNYKNNGYVITKILHPIIMNSNKVKLVAC